jgi:hypothetical protein
MQVVMGEEVPGPMLERLSSLYADLTMGLVAWPYLDLPFTPWRKYVSPCWRALATLQDFELCVLHHL